MPEQHVALRLQATDFIYEMSRMLSKCDGTVEID